MVDQNNDEQQLNAALELLHFGFRAITAQPDKRLAKLGYSRVHHRILYFIGRNPGCSINGLLGIMKVSKQYLNRPLRQLLDDGYVQSRKDSQDQRVKRLSLTRKGKSLEQKLTGEQREQLADVFRHAGAGKQAGWRSVMQLLAEM